MVLDTAPDGIRFSEIGQIMNSYNVFFENTFWGHAWADTAWEAIQKVAGEYSTDENGKRDYRWTVDLFA